MATPLPRVHTVLRSLHSRLPKGVDDLAYRVDIEANGDECLVVHIATEREDTFNESRKRSVERQIRDALAANLSWSVYFRWRTTEEAKAERQVVTNDGLLDRLHSVLP